MWEWIYSPERSSMAAAQGSRIIITSRSESITRFGTTAKALRLQCLSLEASWYFFKMLTFGSDDPRQHPKMENVLQGSFMSAWMAAILLRANFNTQTWSRILTRLRQYIQKNTSLIGEYMDDIRAKDCRRYSWSLVKPKPDKYLMLDDIYHINPAAEADTEVPRITMIDLMSGCAAPQGKCEILYWKSPIPPYYKYVCARIVYLSRDRCMFGRHMEKEAIMAFLLQSEIIRALEKNLGVLPIVGPTHIGKSTLVENVCHDEKVRNHLSLITVYSGNDALRDETVGSFGDKCVINHQNNQASDKRLLISADVRYVICKQ
ncbi:hypothetical protein U9M48_044686 [Paspalum notatum var. saurae]|uniref:Uncharacterized protein n=1 Tax=Paspalum notatum var. saurae TaxID=547442 RepID=A0AAQ3UZT5_PASNO